MQLPQRHRKRRRIYHKDSSVIRLRPLAPNHIWSVDVRRSARTGGALRGSLHDKLSSGRPYKMLTVLDEYTREALCGHVQAKMRSADVPEALYPLLLKQGKPDHNLKTTLLPDMLWPRACRPRPAERAGEGRHRATKDLSWEFLGERTQRAAQRDPAKGDPDCGLVLPRRTGPDRHQHLAQTGQPKTATSGAGHAPADPRNRHEKWPTKKAEGHGLAK